MSRVDVTVGSGVAYCKCGQEVHGAIVLTGPDGSARPLPVVCDKCTRADQLANSHLAIGARPIRTTEDWLQHLGVNTEKHGHATLENFDPSDDPLALEVVREFVAATIEVTRHQRVRGVYLAGLPHPESGETGHGHGKSHLAIAAIRAIHEARPDLTVMYEPADRLVTRVQDSYQHGQTDPLIERRKNADVYVLDDLGRERGTADALRVLCTILDEREGKPTVITSNALPDQLGERHGDVAMWNRVESRLGDDVYRYVKMRGRDRRIRAVS